MVLRRWHTLELTVDSAVIIEGQNLLVGPIFHVPQQLNRLPGMAVSGQNEVFLWVFRISATLAWHLLCNRVT
jgi:hypothetical protein